ncbi:Fe3+/spermidine/putrescine ABC transporter ATP-binding protein [Pelagivirga sediminicola]|uniref:Fe3+/spermidine/putrescine ABC transporter ATP-binding protein n=1 Tax=Pelagivirga sediminicola TaxID=2170575 RepID=A0A2T7GB30_9RHOB|nr:ABC transporter ATP-binding protein [Pelagivirga sediminicola]PVA11622.1 Fe3+/spermidine/putrescine ABC transporter ATP-binding protein [Pelagivirga sediminicola]
MDDANHQPIIEIRDVVKSFGSVKALKGINADIREGEFFSLLGPSGCGKTTLLRLIAGFEQTTSGTIAIAGQSMKDIPANKRPTNMVFQSYAIFPHLNVAENVGYGLVRKKISKADMTAEVEKALSMVDLAGYGQRAAHELSGGQRQRVALARALVMRPKVILLDEPLSALDKKLRDQMQQELRSLQKSLGITFILVTHDQEEALIMSDRIAVIFDGQIAQLASPEELYRRPVSRKIASFIGVMNFLEAEATGATDTHFTIRVPALGEVEIARRDAPAGLQAGQINVVGVRPEMFTIVSDGTGSFARTATGTVISTDYYGDMTYYSVALPGAADPVTISMRNTAGRSIARDGSEVTVGWGADSIVLLE